MPLQFGDDGLSRAMLQGSGLGIEAARLQLAQQAQAQHAAQVAQAQAQHQREYQTGLDQDAAARDSMLSEMDATATMPAPTGTEQDFFAQPTPATGPITPEMRRAPAAAIQDTHRAAMNHVQKQRAQQEETERQWGMYRNLRKQGLARMVSPETYDKAVQAGVEWSPEDAPPERRPIDIRQVLEQLQGGGGGGGMPGLVGPPMPGMQGADTSGLMRMDHTNLGMLGRVAAHKPKAGAADWLAAGATPAQAASFARLGGTVEDVQRFATHTMTANDRAKRETDKLAPTEPEIEAIMRAHPREFPDRQSATDYIVQQKAGLTNQLRAPNDETDDRGHAKWAASELDTRLKLAQDEQARALDVLKKVTDPNNFMATAQEKAEAQADYDTKHGAMRKIGEDLANLYHTLSLGTGGRNPPKNARPARETKPQSSVADPVQAPFDVRSVTAANPKMPRETKEAYRERIKPLVQNGAQR
jgi:hypothetical protein